jgi:hypothetical protein
VPTYKDPLARGENLGISVVRSLRKDAAGNIVQDVVHLELTGYDLTGLAAAVVDFQVGLADTPTSYSLPLPPGFFSVGMLPLDLATQKDNVGLTIPGNIPVPINAQFAHVKAVLHGLDAVTGQVYVVGCSHVSIIQYGH